MTKSVTRLALSLTALAATLALLQGTPAQALNKKSYVSNTGSDVKDCSSIANACATFDHALGQTLDGGEISVLNPGDYSLAFITQSVHITNDGAGEASVLVNLGPGVAIMAGAGDVISVRGLVIDGQGQGQDGIFVSAASALHVQNCVIRNFQAFGSAFGIALSATTNTQLFVSDTIIFNNGSSATTGGISIRPQGTASHNVVLDRVHLENNVIGLWVNGTGGTGNGAHVVIRDSVVSGNASDGIRAITTAGHAPAFLVVERTSVVNNVGTGILANGPGATMLLDGNVVSRNGVGISAVSSGQIISYGNNKVNNNIGPDGVPTGSYSPI